MKLESYGILIGMRPFGERDAVAHIFTRDHGVMTGMLKAAQIARKKPPLVGQIGEVSWNARLDSQLGAFHWEAERNLAAPLMQNPKLLGCMNSAFALVAALLPERESYTVLFNKTTELIQNISAPTYLEWEKILLAELGYALNLNSCSNCGQTSDLNFLSPKTGRAVCDDCAAPYVDRLYRLPLTIDVTLKFLEKICNDQGVSIPPARKWLVS